MNHHEHRQVVWLVCELYHPELTSTGWYVTGLAEGLADTFDMRVICARPNYRARGTVVPSAELRNGVSILRCATPVFDTGKLGRRLLGALMQTAAMACLLWRHLRGGDIVIVVTNPPSLPFAIAPLARWRGARCVLDVNDLYPDALVCAGLLRASGWPARSLLWLTRSLYRQLDHIVVDGRDAQRLLRARSTGTAPVQFTPYWSDVDLARPARAADDFVVLYAGNMGRLHDLPTVLRAAQLLQDEPRLRWRFRGDGVRRRQSEAFAANQRLANVSFVDARPWTELADVLAEGDVGIIAMQAGSAGMATPSRMYNLLAAGKPIIAITDAGSELADMVLENQAGWTIAPGDAPALAGLLRRLLADRDSVRAAGHRALAASALYPRSRRIEAFRSLLCTLSRRGSPPAAR